MIGVPVTWIAREVKSVIAAAYGLASGRWRTVIGEEDLLQVLTESARGGVLLSPLTPALVREEVVPAVARARESGGLSSDDRTALSGLGLDVDALLSQASSGLGEPSPGPVRPEGGWGQRMSDAAAVVLARAEDAAVAQGTRTVEVDHLVLALVETPSLVTEHLRSRGVTPAVVGERLGRGE